MISQEFAWLEAFQRKLLRDDITEDDHEGRDLPSHICFRSHLLTFDDARAAADGLQAGIPQIISLSKAPEEMAQRLQDFLLGVAYGVSAHLNSVSETVFLLAPAASEIICDEVWP